LLVSQHPFPFLPTPSCSVERCVGIYLCPNTTFVVIFKSGVAVKAKGSRGLTRVHRAPLVRLAGGVVAVVVGGWGAAFIRQCKSHPFSGKYTGAGAPTLGIIHNRALACTPNTHTLLQHYRGCYSVLHATMSCRSRCRKTCLVRCLSPRPEHCETPHRDQPRSGPPTHLPQGSCTSLRRWPRTASARRKTHTRGSLLM
jgi:hypothetical protein